MSLSRMAALVAAILFTAGLGSSSAELFQVTSTSNSGPGSLRQAILDTWRVEGSHVIEFDLPAGATPRVIFVEGQFLPPLRGPVVVRVKVAASPSQLPASGRQPALFVAPNVVLDGSRILKPRDPAACPGATSVYNRQSNQWENSREQGTGPNVRGYASAGLAVHDSASVEISGIEIRNFCSGVAVVRSHDVTIRNVKIAENHGAAGVIFTGDDGNAGSTSASYNNRLTDSVLLDNADGFEFTRGTRDSLVENTYIALTRPLPVDGNAVEYATAGNNNALIGNTFTNYAIIAVTVGSGRDHQIRDNVIAGNGADGMRVSGESALIVGNTFVNNGGDALAVNGAGSRVVDNVFSRNSGRAVVVGGNGITVIRNAMYANARLAIDVAELGAGRGQGGRAGTADAATAAAGRGRGAGPAPAAGRGGGGTAAAVATPPPDPPALPNAPVLASSSRWTAPGLVVDGTLAGKPNESYQVHLYLSREADRHQGDERGWGEGERYIGVVSARADGAGRAAFTLSVPTPDVFGDGRTSGFVTATATDAAGSTSKFSRALPLTR